MVFFERYPKLAEDVRQAAGLAASLKATLAWYNAKQSPIEVGLWAVAVAGHISVVMELVSHLAQHPEWAEELECLLEPVGCPAFKTPLMVQFLAEKGVKINEGTAVIVAQ